jgi:exosortase C (VPDSG-CTERM-specific)
MTPAAPARPKTAVPLTAANVPQRQRSYIIAVVAILAIFSLPLSDVARLCWTSELHSYIALIPFVSWYLVRFVDQRSLISRTQPARNAASVIGALGIGLFGLFIIQRYVRHLRSVDALWLATLAGLLSLLAIELFHFGSARVRAHAFALAILLFAIPLPSVVTDTMSRWLQDWSAEAADWLITMSGLPVYRTGMHFQLPGIALRVAEECSGVRSTLVLFITSLIAGKLFLRAGWKRATLGLATVPLGILRNGFRIMALSWLTVNVDPRVIHGPLHHQGGPVFFVLSLVPLLGLLWWFRKSESKAHNPT